MLAPSLGTGSHTLLSSADHTGTQVPMLVIWLILDRVRQSSTSSRGDPSPPTPPWNDPPPPAPPGRECAPGCGRRGLGAVGGSHGPSEAGRASGLVGASAVCQ